MHMPVTLSSVGSEAFCGRAGHCVLSWHHPVSASLTLSVSPLTWWQHRSRSTGKSTTRSTTRASSLDLPLTRESSSREMLSKRGFYGLFA